MAHPAGTFAAPFLQKDIALDVQVETGESEIETAELEACTHDMDFRDVVTPRSAKSHEITACFWVISDRRRTRRPQRQTWFGSHDPTSGPLSESISCIIVPWSVCSLWRSQWQPRQQTRCPTQEQQQESEWQDSNSPPVTVL